MSGVRSYKFITCIFLKKIIAVFLAQFRKNLYLCNIVATMTLATKICGMAIEKIFLSARGSSA